MTTTSPESTEKESPSPNPPAPKTEIVTPTPSTSSSLGISKDTADSPRSQSKSTITPAAIRQMTTAELVTLCQKLENSSKWLERSLAREKLPAFLEKVIQWPEEISYLPSLRHIQEWCSLVEQYDKLLVEASRDHFKSSFFSFALPLYWVNRVKDPKDAFGIAMFAYADAQSGKYIKRIRQEIENNPWLKWLMPKSKSSVWDSSTLDMSNGCWIESYGFGSSFRGRHPNKILVDDPCKELGSGSMSLEQQIQFFCGTLIPAAKKKGVGQIIVTGNPVDKIDFLEWLEQNKAFELRKYPAWNEAREPLAPTHYTLEQLEDKQSIIPPHIFAREYLLKRVSSADSRFKEEWIVYYDPRDITDKPLYRVMTIDPAMAPGGDALAGVVTGADSKGNVYVLECLLHHGGLDSGVAKLVDMMVLYKPDFIGFEEFGLQAMYKVHLEAEIKRRGLYFNIRSVGRDSKKKKSARIESLQPILSQHKLYFRREHKSLITQLLLWDPISKTNDDDGIDALAYQVPLWRKPQAPGAPARIDSPGSFNEAFTAVRKSKMSNDFLGRLFEDMIHHG